MQKRAHATFRWGLVLACTRTVAVDDDGSRGAQKDPVVDELEQPGERDAEHVVADVRADRVRDGHVALAGAAHNQRREHVRHRAASRYEHTSAPWTLDPTHAITVLALYE